VFPYIKEHHICKMKVMRPVHRGITSGVASSDLYENAQGRVSLHVKPTTHVEGLFFTSRDVIGGSDMKAQLIGASLCLHAVLGYDTCDVLMRNRNAISEIRAHS
jgi:hypothetical protein